MSGESTLKRIGRSHARDLEAGQLQPMIGRRPQGESNATSELLDKTSRLKLLLEPVLGQRIIAVTRNLLVAMLGIAAAGRSGAAVSIVTGANRSRLTHWILPFAQSCVPGDYFSVPRGARRLHVVRLSGQSQRGSPCMRGSCPQVSPTGRTLADAALASGRSLGTGCHAGLREDRPGSLPRFTR